MGMASSTLSDVAAAPAPMRLLKSLSLSAFSMGVRLTASLLSISVLARVLGAAGFGALMIFLSAAGVLCIVSSLGINTHVLREVGRAPRAAAQVVAEALTAKLILTLATLGLALVLAVVSQRFVDPVFALLLLALVAEGFVEFFNVGLRATGRFAIEAKQSVVAALVYSGFVIVAALTGGGLLWVAGAYLASRVLVALVAFATLRRVLGAMGAAPMGAGLCRLRGMLSYSVDAALSALFGQVDGLVLGAYLPAAAVGIYQGGLRIFMAATTATGILTNVLLPKVSGEMAAQGQAASAGSDQVILIFSAFGIVVGWLFALLLPPLVVMLYGPAFESLRTLMPWFGLLFAARLVAGAWGLLLTAKGQQRYRTICSATHWLFIALLTPFTVPAWGALGWIVAMLVGTVFLCILYGVRAWGLVKSRALAVAASASPLTLLAYVLISSRAA